MQNGTTIAISRLVAQQRAMDVASANLANANTAGYRASRMLFSDWLLREPANARSPGEASIAYTQDRATFRDQSKGSFASTGNPLDLAIGDPSGYFTVRTANGPRLTRGGHFTIGPSGDLVNTDGDALLDTTGQPLRLAPSDTHITVSADGSLTTENGAVGKIGVVSPGDPNQLGPEGDDLTAANTPTQATAKPSIVQGAIESSNVESVSEMTRMMSELREFQFVAQYVQGESDRQNSVIDKLSQRPA